MKISQCFFAQKNPACVGLGFDAIDTEFGIPSDRYRNAS